jgi:hypothetical protein
MVLFSVLPEPVKTMRVAPGQPLVVEVVERHYYVAEARA